MEFPPEILAIIRKYSEPRFKHFREYNRIVQFKSRTWPALRFMLETDPESVLPLMKEYEQAVLAFLVSRRAFHQRNSMEWERYIELVEDYHQKRLSLLTADRKLQGAVQAAPGAWTFLEF